MRKTIKMYFYQNICKCLLILKSLNCDKLGGVTKQIDRQLLINHKNKNSAQQHDNLSSLNKLQNLKRSFSILLDLCRMLIIIVFSTIKKKRDRPPPPSPQQRLKISKTITKNYNNKQKKIVVKIY